MNAIETHDLTKIFKDCMAVDHLNLSIPEGQLFALLGVNGAGKTTAIRMLCGLIPPTNGDAFLMGHSILQDADKAKALMNISPQETAIAPNLTVQENLEFIAGIYGMKAVDARSAADEIILSFHLDEVRKRRAGRLSGGWQRRLSIAMALITRPKILFLDEPTLGLDILARRELWQLIESMKGNITIVLTTHYLEEAEALSDCIGIMAQGALKAVGTVEELKTLTNTDSFEDAFVTLAAERGAIQ